MNSALFYNDVCGVSRYNINLVYNKIARCNVPNPCIFFSQLYNKDIIEISKRVIFDNFEKGEFCNIHKIVIV